MFPTPFSVADPAAAPDWRYVFNGVLFIALLSLGVSQLSTFPVVVQWGVSPLVIGILVGMLYGNAALIPPSNDWEVGINFCARRLLRIAIAVYGFNISLQQIASVGLTGLAMSMGVVISTLILGLWLGRRWFGLDRDTALLTAAGSAICGAAAVLAFESALDNQPHKSAIAVATVVLFGTFSLILFPLAYHAGWLVLDARSWGLFVGGTIHEVAQVVGAGSAMSPAIVEVATIIKMMRVALLLPVLLVLGVWLNRGTDQNNIGSGTGKIPIPWFAFGFLLFSLLNSMAILPPHWVKFLRQTDIFLLTMAMTALGIQTRFSHLREAGPRALGLAAVLFVWLLVTGYSIVVIMQ